MKMGKQQHITNNVDLYGEEETVNLKDFVIGALVGSIVGAAAGLLLAPKAGRELRSDVATQAVTLKDKSVELSSTAKDKTVQFSNQLKEQSTQLVDKVKAKTQKTNPVLDDGTVSYEGEEPLDGEFGAVATDVDPDIAIAEEAVVTEAPDVVIEPDPAVGTAVEGIEEANAESKHTLI